MKLKMQWDFKKSQFQEFMERSLYVMEITNPNAGKSKLSCYPRRRTVRPHTSDFRSFMSDFSTTDDGQNANPIDFPNDFIKLNFHLAVKAKIIHKF